MIIENKEFKKLKTINTKINKGDGIIFKKYLPHKSGINKSNKVRLSLVQSFHDIKTIKKIGKLNFITEQDIFTFLDMEYKLPTER